MRLSWHQSILIVLIGSVLLITSARSVEAEQPKSVNAEQQQLIRRDRLGDTLPNGALIRLGTTRLRQKQGVEGVAFSPDGKHLVSTGWGDSIRFWDVNTGSQVRLLKNERDEATFAVAFSPDGQLMASVGDRGMIRLWELSSGKIRFETVGHSERSHGVRVYGVAFSPEGSTFATTGDTSIRVWDVASGDELLELQDEGGGNAHPVAFSRDGNLLASGSGRQNGSIRIWDLNAGGEPIVIEKAHGRGITSLAFTPDGKHLISCGAIYQRTGERSGRSMSQIRIWDVADGQGVGQFKTEEDLVGDCSLALSADGNILCSSHQKNIVIWDVESRQALRVIETDCVQLGGRTHGLAISPDGKLVASKAFDHKVHVWNVETGEPALQQDEAHTNAVISVQFSPDGSKIATGSADATVRLWDAETGEHLRIVGESSGWVRYVEFFPDGQYIALGAETRIVDKPRFEGEVKICRVTDGETVEQFLTDDRVICGDLSPDGERIAIGTGLGRDMGAYGEGEAPEVRIYVWEIKTGNEPIHCSGHEGRIQQISFVPNGDELWSTSQDQTIRRWNGHTGEELHQQKLALKGSSRASRKAVLTPDATSVIIGGLQRIDRETRFGILRAMSTKGSTQLWQQKLQDCWPSLLAISRDGSTLAVYLRAFSQSNIDNRITLLSVDDGEELVSFNLEDGSVRSLSFSPDGKKLASGMDRGDTLVWDLSALKID